MEMIRWALAGAILGVGLLGLFLQRRTLARAVSVNILNSGLVLLFVLLGAESGDVAPILFTGDEAVVDPLVQALMLTAIVIGVCVTALLLVLGVRMYRITGASTIDGIEQWMREHDD